MVKSALTALALAWVLLGGSAAQATDPGVLKERGETEAQRDARMQWFRDARFGMFIHWGLYAQHGGFWHGKTTAAYVYAEWLMFTARAPVAEYAAAAKDFNPVNYDADAWVRAAKAAGMKYIVITTKHHEGFAMFKTAASPFNIVDASPYGKDVLKPLAEACRRHGMKLGFYYSQNLDWHHPGGGLAGPDWDPAQKGDPEKYVSGIVEPQLREILSNYGDVAVLWFDISGGVIDKPRADRIWKLVTELQPGIIINNRLGGGYQGDIQTPENHIPPGGFPGKDWEACMTMNGTWGFSKSDNNWKSARELIHNLADIASKGGNYLLNVGPNEKGEIPAPSLERLAKVGEWMQVNGEAIHATRSAGFSTLPEWGRITKRENKDGTTTLYAIVYDAPKSGVITVSGLSNAVLDAKLLGDTSPVKAANEGSVVSVTLPDSVKTKQDFVVAIRLQGALALDTAAYADAASAVFRLPPRAAVTTKGLREEDVDFTGTKHAPEPHLGFWTNPAATATWEIKAKIAGAYTLTARIGAHAASAGSVIEFVSGDTVLPLEIKPTGDWNKYETVTVGALNLPAGESKLTVRVKTLKGQAPCNLGELRLEPKNRSTL